tara:strand:- start:144922 stop:145698 length:777 start_codon:yes stop_codon:yes gene_type:complete
MDAKIIQQLKQQGNCFIKLPNDIHQSIVAIQATAFDYFHQPDDIKKQMPFADGNGYINHADSTVHNVQRYIFRGKKPATTFEHCQDKMKTVRRYYFEHIFTPLIKNIFKDVGITEAAESVLDDADYTLSLVYYPACNSDNLGLTPHKDSATLTALWAQQPGFEAKIEGQWQPITIDPGYIAVQVGKSLEIMTNGAYKALEHRVMLESETERLSMASFFTQQFDKPLVNYVTDKVIHGDYRKFLSGDVKKTHETKDAPA